MDLIVAFTTTLTTKIKSTQESDLYIVALLSHLSVKISYVHGKGP
jgi:hypothetical protein